MKIFKLSKKTIIFLVIWLLAIAVRFWKMEYVPFQNDADELCYVFAGQSLIEKGKPISWSSFNYPESRTFSRPTLGDVSFNTQETFHLVTPWFDHPYLLSLIQGSISILFGYHFPSVPPSLIVRLPMIFLAAATLFLIYSIVTKLFDYKAGLFVLMIVGFSPSLILGQRMAGGENLYIPMILLAIRMCLEKPNILKLVVLSLASVLSKMTGIVLIPIVNIYYLLRQNYKKMLTYNILVILGLLVFIGIFALIYGWNEYLEMIRFQSFRLLGWSNPAFIFSSPGFHNYILLDGSYFLILILGLAGLFLMGSNNNARLLQLTTFLLFIEIWATSAEQDMLGWYKLPFFIILSLGIGGIYSEKRHNLLSLLLVIVTVNNFGLIRFPTNPLPSTEILRLTIGTIFLTCFVLTVFSTFLTQKLSRIIFIVSCCFYLIFSFYFVDKFYEAKCKDRICPVPTLRFNQLIRF